MKAKFLALSLAGVLALSATAQETSSEAYTTTLPGKKVSFKKNKGTDNWFITLQGGTNLVTSFGANHFYSTPKDKFFDVLGYSAGIGFGKWDSPYFGARLMLDWNMFKDYTYGKTDNYDGVHSFNPHIDFLFNLNNYFGAYNPKRVFSVVPFLGVGYSGTLYNWNDKAKNDAYGKSDFINGVTGDAGINFSFRLARRASLDIAPALTVGKFFTKNVAVAHLPFDMMFQLKAGLTFDAGRPDFEAIEPMDYALVNDLNSQLNSLRSENAELSKRPVSCPECPEVKEVTNNKIIDNVVYFRLNKSVVDRNQLVHVFNTAEFVKSTGTPIKVVGYADVKTGNAKYNMALSERRAREVARILVEKYGVPSELITIDFKGSDEQVYQVNAWNRVVFMKNQEK